MTEAGGLFVAGNLDEHWLEMLEQIINEEFLDWSLELNLENVLVQPAFAFCPNENINGSVGAARP